MPFNLGTMRKGLLIENDLFLIHMKQAFCDPSDYLFGGETHTCHTILFSHVKLYVCHGHLVMNRHFVCLKKKVHCFQALSCKNVCIGLSGHILGGNNSLEIN